MKRRFRWSICVRAITVLILAGALARPLYHLARTASRDVNELQQLSPGYTNDASRLNLTKVAEVVPVIPEKVEQQLAELLARARSNGTRVAIAGAQHSMGGHTIYPDGIVLDTRTFNRMQIDSDGQILHVGSGALWKDVIPYLDGFDRSVAVMQSNNSFSVGGSISVNCHGWQYDRPPIASTVESFRLMKADGSIVRCSRDENQEVFSLALGGYGLFGVILDVDLRTVPNERYRLEQFIVPVDQSLATFDSKILGRPGLQMVYARMNIVPQHLFEAVIINAFFLDSNGSLPQLSQAGLSRLRRTIFRGSAESDYGKELRWNAETKLQPHLAGKIFSRNQLLNEGVEVFQNQSASSTDILHEYFVPRDRVVGFVDEMRRIIRRHQPNLLNVTIRGINLDEDTYLRYADQSMIAFVLLFVQEKTESGEADMEEMTRELIDAAITRGGRYYLPYRLHATPEQFERAYPQARGFFELKRKYDPDELFQNAFYVKYGSASGK